MIALGELVELRRRLSSTRKRTLKQQWLVEFLTALQPEQVGWCLDYLAGQLPMGRIGVGPAALRKVAKATQSASESTLELARVDAVLRQIQQTSGAGSAAAKESLLAELFNLAVASEREYLAGLLFGELRQGASEKSLVVAVAEAFGADLDEVRRATMVSGGVARVAAALARQGQSCLKDFRLEPLVAIKPMLASPIQGVSAALDRIPSPQAEWKLDGIRVQLHREGDRVKVFSRSLREVTWQVPALVNWAEALKESRFILDGEVLALQPDGRPFPFQDTMKRFSRKGSTGELRFFFFDCLLHGEEVLLDEPLGRRREFLERLTTPEERIPARQVDNEEALEAWLDEAMDAGHEGLMVKDLASPYEADNRGFSWLKLKPAHTLDLVVLAAEWGSGRRRGWLSNLHLGALEPSTGEFVMLGKTFKGLTDEMLQFQTERLLALEVSRDDYTVYVEPSLVVEVAVNEVQESSRYQSGLALRFARVKRFREDKNPTEIDHLATVAEIFQRNR